MYIYTYIHTYIHTHTHTHTQMISYILSKRQVSQPPLPTCVENLLNLNIENYLTLHTNAHKMINSMAPKSDSKRCKTRPYADGQSYSQHITTFFLGHHFHNHPFWVHTSIIPLLVYYTAHMSDKLTYYHRFLLAYYMLIH